LYCPHDDNLCYEHLLDHGDDGLDHDAVEQDGVDDMEDSMGDMLDNMDMVYMEHKDSIQDMDDANMDHTMDRTKCFPNYTMSCSTMGCTNYTNR
jgi:hypothetical protein